MLCFLDFTAFLNFKNPLSSYLFCIRMIRVSQCNKQSKKRSGFVPEAVFLSHVAGVMNLVCFEMCFSTFYDKEKFIMILFLKEKFQEVLQLIPLLRLHLWEELLLLLVRFMMMN